MNRLLHRLTRWVKLFLLFSVTMNAFGQTLTISDTGDTGPSGTNWSSSGTNPVIITATGTANVNTSVIKDYLDDGKSVMLEGSLISVANAIDKTAGGDATLTIRAGGTNSEGYGRAAINANIQSTSGALNIVLWSDYNNHNRAGATVSSSPTINTNGGHFWVGGSATTQGSTTWNGLTVGNGPSVNAVGFTNQNAVDINGLALNTSGGDVFIWAAPGAGGGIQGIAFASSSISTGTGDIILATDVIGGIDGAASLTSSGHLYLVPDGGAYPGDVTWSHNNIFTGTTNLSGTFGALNINAFNGLGGFTIGAYAGMAGLNFSNSSNITVSNRIYNDGSISLYGGNITLNENLTSIATSAAVLVNATGNIIQTANGIITTQGGGVVLRSNSNDTDNGRIELLRNITTNGGALYVGGGSASETLDGLSVPTGNATTTENNRNGINIWSANINTSGGNLRMRGQNTSVDGINTGVLVSNCTIQTGAGQLSLFGKRIGNPEMSGGLWLGTIINRSDATGNVTLSTTTGDILLEGVAELNNSHVYTHALMMAAGVTDQLNIGTTFGDIYLKGNGSNTMVQSGGTNAIRAQVGATTAGINITTNGGAIEFEGISANTSGNEGIAFSPASVSGSIKIGAAFTGNITFKTGSLRTETRAVGAIDITSIGNVVFEGPAGGNFAADINITNEYDIGANITGLRFGKTDNTNATVNLFAPVSIKGPLSIYANHVNLSNSITTSNADIFIQGATSISAEVQNRTLNSGSGNITLRTNLLSKTPGQVTISSTGTFTFQPFGTAFSSVDYGSAFALSGTLTNNTFIGTGDAVGLRINNVNQLRGLVFGKEGNTTGFSTWQDWTVDGPITFIGGDILLLGNLTSTANAAAILLKAAGNITVTQTKTLQTNKGDLIFWADSDADNNGFIALHRDVTLNSANGDTASGLSTGGAIVLAGGADDGANGGVSGDGKPDGFAQSASSPGINLGTAGTNTLSENHFYSGGGDVILRGKSSNAQGTDTYNNAGINQHGGFFVNAGTGRISMLGESANFYGINLNENPVNSTTPKLILNSAAITGDAIYLRGVSSSRDG